MKTKNIITALCLLPFTSGVAKADSLFEEFRDISKMMHQSFERHLKEMDEMFSHQSALFNSVDTKAPGLEIKTHENESNITVTLSFKNASPKDGTCKIEFEDTANGSQWMQVIWQLSSSQEASAKPKTLKSDKEKSEQKQELSTTQTYSMNFARTLLLPCAVDTEKADIKQIDDHTVQVTLPKINKRKTIRIDL